MFEVSIQADFSAAHRLRGYKGKCENMHGHNWKVEVFAAQEILDKQGMVVDFAVLKKTLNKVLMNLDHKNLNSIPYFKKINPTSENIAKYIYDKLKSGDLNIYKIVVWETDTASATYFNSSLRGGRRPTKQSHLDRRDILVPPHQAHLDRRDILVPPHQAGLENPAYPKREIASPLRGSQ